MRKADPQATIMAVAPRPLRAGVANAAFAAATENPHGVHRLHRYERHPDAHIPPDTIRA